MIRFVDISAAYFGCDESELPPQKMCAFLDTIDNRFVEDPTGEHVFHSLDEVREVENIGERCARLVPSNFWASEET